VHYLLSNILSHPVFHQENLEYVVNLLLENCYPLELIFQKINDRIDKIIWNSTKKKEIKQISKIEENQRKLIVLPYIKNVSESIDRSIDRKKYLTGYRILNKNTGFIKRHKDINNYEDNNNIVYKVSCVNCNASYVGQTKRKLKTRLKEHMKNIRLDDSKHSVITKHMLEYNHTFDWENAKILDYESNYFKRMIAEMIHIKIQKNGLNSVEDIEGLDSSYFNLLTKICNQQQ